MKLSALNRITFYLFRISSGKVAKLVFTTILLIILWLFNSNLEAFLPNAITTTIGIIWALGTGDVKQSETIARVVHSIPSQKINSKPTQGTSVQSKQDSEIDEEVLKYLLQKGVITKQQYNYSVFAKEIINE